MVQPHQDGCQSKDARQGEGEAAVALQHRAGLRWRGEGGPGQGCCPWILPSPDHTCVQELSLEAQRRQSLDSAPSMLGLFSDTQLALAEGAL